MHSETYNGSTNTSYAVSYNKSFSSYSGTLEFDTGRLYNTYSVSVERARLFSSVSFGIDPTEEVYFLNVSFKRQNIVGIYKENYYETDVDIKPVDVLSLVCVAIIAVPEVMIGLGGLAASGAASGINIYDSIGIFGDLVEAFA